MSYYKDKEKTDPASINRRQVGPKDINDPLFDTDQRDKKPGEGSVPLQDDPSVPKVYDGSKNSGGSKSATQNPEQ
jgi:hypothetical protein